jgi:molybdopterin/thiamine biosynthesis adenylyltransferase
MSSKLIAPDSGLQQLADEGFRVEIRQQHLLVHVVPYVTASREVKRGTLACLYVESGGRVSPPNALNGGDSHQVWWQGEYPCFADGKPLSALENEHNTQELLPGFTVHHRFSNKPQGVEHFLDHYDKVKHYTMLIQAQAGTLEPWSQAQTGGVTKSNNEDSVFRYPDTASARAEIMMTAAQLAIGKVAIIGIGGTGSYVLDQLAKTPVQEIHLFDGDLFEQHNAFRSPGAATEAEIDARLPKTEIFRRRYDPMRHSVVSHPYFLDCLNIAELDGMSFVFICVDKAEARRLIFDHLRQKRIPFVDVGMNLQQIKGTLKLVGSCRATLVTPGRDDHVDRCVPLEDDDDDAIYQQNIQIADMNALNAQLAVMLWKQYCGFYQAAFDTRNLVFAVNMTSLVREVGELGVLDEA